jgi:hypothetical protein
MWVTTTFRCSVRMSIRIDFLQQPPFALFFSNTRQLLSIRKANSFEEWVSSSIKRRNEIFPASQRFEFSPLRYLSLSGTSITNVSLEQLLCYGVSSVAIGTTLVNKKIAVGPARHLEIIDVRPSGVSYRIFDLFTVVRQDVKLLKRIHISGFGSKEGKASVAAFQERFPEVKVEFFSG